MKDTLVKFMLVATLLLPKTGHKALRCQSVLLCLQISKSDCISTDCMQRCQRGMCHILVVCRTNHEAAFEAEGRQLRFLANVDPVDVARALNGLKQETTLVVVVSKTFTTAETMLNARTVRYVFSGVTHEGGRHLLQQQKSSVMACSKIILVPCSLVARCLHNTHVKSRLNY